MKIDGARIDDLDQVNFPDPVMNAINANAKLIDELKEDINKLEAKKSENIENII